jgi:hypothetical protein
MFISQRKSWSLFFCLFIQRVRESWRQGLKGDEVRGCTRFRALARFLDCRVGRRIRYFVWVRTVSDFIFEITFEIEELIVSCVHRRIAVNIIEGG